VAECLRQRSRRACTISLRVRFVKPTRTPLIVVIAAEGIDESHLPAQGYVPTATGEHAPVPTQGYNVGSTGLATDPKHKTVFDSGLQH
jgi:hypothetical protein